ncbi:succinate dehydrogenase [Ferrimicrobium acidiphilum]|uniref:Uncharacterized protein n=1 Tax=Ferrimicrobium acidiphilum DSM 19497 TaxID=1121877 RepID=A0A0D8FUI6_9ACTN|nr:succinate dehydrogenase [Ferrimicrobium acidiphilum]KJE76624.1 hypothetical protein FEAC_15530 [Ferrimicrobium acidiphilum DSM 19497]
MSNIIKVVLGILGLIIAFALISFVLKLISMISTIVIVGIIVGVVVSLIRRGRSKRKNTAA